MKVFFLIYLEQWLDILDSEDILDNCNIEILFKYAIDDISSTEIWTRYCKYIEINYNNDYYKICNIYENGINVVGKNLREGFQIWNSYINFIKKTKINPSNDIINKIRELYHKQFSVPLKENEDDYQNYVDWETSVNGDVQNCMEVLVTSQEQFEKCTSYENDIAIADDDKKLELWRKYIEYIKNNFNEDYVIVYFILFY